MAARLRRPPRGRVRAWLGTARDPSGMPSIAGKKRTSLEAVVEVACVTSRAKAGFHKDDACKPNVYIKITTPTESGTTLKPAPSQLPSDQQSASCTSAETCHDTAHGQTACLCHDWLTGIRAPLRETTKPVQLQNSPHNTLSVTTGSIFHALSQRARQGTGATDGVFLKAINGSSATAEPARPSR
jgi:hypothetical protein